MRVQRVALSVALLFVLAFVAHAQKRPSVSVRLTQGIVKLGAQVGLIVEVDGTERASIAQVPEVAGLTIGPVSRPSKQFYQQIIGSRYTSTTRTTWTIDVRPIGTGEFTIPPVVLDIDGQLVETRSLKLKVVEDLRGGELGLFEIEPSTNTVVEGEPFSIRIRCGLDKALLGVSNNTYIEFSLPWWGVLPGTLDLEQPAPTGSYNEVGLNGSDTIIVEQRGEVERGGRTFAIFEAKKNLLATRTGRLEFSGNVFEFGKLTGGGFFNRKSKAQSYYVVAEPFAVDVVALPEEGRPFDFGGAIGDMEVRASTDTRDLKVGDSVKLTVEWFGQGNFEFFEAPDPSRIDAFSDFRVYGSTERSKGFDHRSVVYDLAPLSADVERIPELRLPVFDPELNDYVELLTPSIPIRVRPLEGARSLGGEELEESYDRDVEDIAAALPSSRGRADLPTLPAAAWGGALVGTPLLWLLLRTRVRRILGDPNAPLERRRRRARRTLARDLAKASSAREELDAVLAFLAARSREGRSAWIGRDVEDYLARRNGETRLSEEDRRDLARLLEEMEASVYGDAGRAPEKSAVLSLADRLIGGGL